MPVVVGEGEGLSDGFGAFLGRYVGITGSVMSIWLALSPAIAAIAPTSDAPTEPDSWLAERPAKLTVTENWTMGVV